MVARKAFLLFFLLFSIGNSPSARAETFCVPVEHAETIADITANFFLELMGTQLWLEYIFLPDTVYPAFKSMAKEWSVGDQDVTKKQANFVTHQQEELTKTELQRLKANMMVQLAPVDNMCHRITHRAGLLSAYTKAQATHKTLSHSLTESMLSKAGTPGQGSPALATLAQHKHYLDNNCTGQDLGGALKSVCPTSNPPCPDCDIDPTVYFEKLTVDHIDPTSPETSANFQAYVKNIVGDSNISLLDARYYEDASRQDELQDFFQYANLGAFAYDPFVSVASTRAPGPHPFMPEHRQTLNDLGFSDSEIDLRFLGETTGNLSFLGTLEMMVMSHKNPKELGPDQMKSETALLGQDALSLSTELILWRRYEDSWETDARTLSLLMGLKLKEQRKKANTKLLSFSDNGKKS